MSESKVLKGQAYIMGSTLYQEQILVTPGAVSETQTEVLIEDIWEDLIDGPGTSKNNGSGYFYWEVEQTDTMDDNITLTIKFECPRPIYNVYDRLKESTTDYGKYWAEKLKTATENYEYKAAIQKKEIIFPGTSYIDQTGNVVEIEEQRVENTDLGDITNLLSMF